MKKNKSLSEEEIKELEKGPTKEFHPYKKDGIFGKIPFPIKALFIKWWFFGCGFYFIFWGLSNIIGGDQVPTGDYQIILIFILSLFNGVITDIVVDHLLELMDDNRNIGRYFIIFHSNKLYSLFINILYSILLTSIIVIVFDSLGSLGLFSSGLEPILVGIFTLIIDMLFISIKNLIVYFIEKKKGVKEDV